MSYRRYSDGMHDDGEKSNVANRNFHGLKYHSHFGKNAPDMALLKLSEEKSCHLMTKILLRSIEPEYVRREY